MQFTKMQAAGNDFVVINNTLRASRLPAGKAGFALHQLPLLARKLCDRRFGIGGDGVLILEKSAKCDFKMRIFNPDGSEAEMCGNGLRCLSFFAYKNKIAASLMSVETKAGILSAQVSSNKVKINMLKPSSIKLGIDISIGGKSYKVHHINTGVPHAIVFVDNLDAVNVKELGRALRYHSIFKPKGANVDFVKIKSKGTIAIRTYERGVEAETLACGTGATASAVISGIVKQLQSPVSVSTKGGLLKVYFKKKNNIVTDVFLEGEACVVFEGMMSLA